MSKRGWLILSSIIGVLIASLWLSGALFLWFANLDIKQSSPITIFKYAYYFGHQRITQFYLILSVTIGFAPVIAFVAKKLKTKQLPLYGDAKFADTKQIKQAGLLAKSGIVVGKKRFGLSEQYLQFAGQQHVLMSAPTRSGKGVGVVIPNLLSWKDSVVVLDIKQENWHISAGFRKSHGQQCFLLNLAPRNYQSHRWNPLYYISNDPSFRINDIQKIGQMLFPNIDNEAPVWQASARSLWLGLVLYLIESPPLPVTMGEVLRLLTQGDEYLAQQLELRLDSNVSLSSQCLLALKEYLDTPERTRGSVRKSFTSALELFYNPVIDAVTAGNDFDLRHIRQHKMSIYVGVTPDDLNRLSPLINLFFQQLIDLNTRELPEQNPQLKYQVLLLLDEFAAIGKVNILSKGISYVAGYGLRLLTIIQSPAQLREIYGHDGAETLIDNHALQIVFAPKNPKVAREISDSLGTSTINNRSRSRQLSGKGGKSENISDHGRALMLPQELMQMGADNAILLLENCPPVKCKKLRWYQDKQLSVRGNYPDKNHYSIPNIPKVTPKQHSITITQIRCAEDGDTTSVEQSEADNSATSQSSQPNPEPIYQKTPMNDLVTNFKNVVGDENYE
ncbi:type IV secretory system conjugative DNA transfer family protein [Parashewanella curva]|uniref:Type IV secretory system conjugative DNA transfer family protein n=1 Tax=Parashewanella curva TaxID=2338552 RepID=A0A3L8PY75_9GAMM|nr:type IV secretory system conjugative DNA transfer family protein [Parashewanella curva]RLV60376.1 type IV secretory system conjugative DNA transfer family protein [Parashewanella curva]